MKLIKVVVSLILFASGTFVAFHAFGETRKECYNECQKQFDDCSRDARRHGGKDMNEVIFNCGQQQLRCQRACAGKPAR